MLRVGGPPFGLGCSPRCRTAPISCGEETAGNALRRVYFLPLVGTKLQSGLARGKRKNILRITAFAPPGMLTFRTNTHPQRWRCEGTAPRERSRAPSARTFAGCAPGSPPRM